MTAHPPQDDNRRSVRSGRVWLAGLIVAAASAFILPQAANAADGGTAGGDNVPSTSSYIPTTTTGEPSLDVTAFSSVCVADTPFIQYAIKPIGFSASGPATLSFYDKNGTFIESRVVTALSGRILYPGASVDANGNPTDWPGWKKAQNGNWEPDPTDAAWRDGLTIKVSVDAPSGLIFVAQAEEASATVTYPPASDACSGPPEEGLGVTAFSPVCIADAPFIDYSITTTNFEFAGPATLSFYDKNGTLVETQVVPTLSGRIIYPGASVDANGNATDWPGWKKAENGDWIPDDSDAILREGLTVKVTVTTPSGFIFVPQAVHEATSTVSYPPSTSTCDGPEEIPPTTTIVPPTTITPPTTTICVETTSSSGGSGATTTGGSHECYPCVPGTTTGGSSSTTGGSEQCNPCTASTTGGSSSSATTGGDPACQPCSTAQTTSSSATTGATDPSCALPRTGSDGTQKIVTIGAIVLAAGAGFALLARRRKGAAPL